MTKKQMIQVIKESNMVINFSKSYFNRLLKKDVERFYSMALHYAKSK